jgi:hypothetical protein
MSATARARVSALAESLDATGSTPTNVAVAVAATVPGAGANAVTLMVEDAPLATDARLQVTGNGVIEQVPAAVTAAETLAPVTGIWTLTGQAFGPALRTVTV